MHGRFPDYADLDAQNAYTRTQMCPIYIIMHEGVHGRKHKQIDKETIRMGLVPR